MHELSWLFWVLVVFLITESWGRALVVSLGTAPDPVSGRDPGSDL